MQEMSEAFVITSHGDKIREMWKNIINIGQKMPRNIMYALGLIEIRKPGKHLTP
jgi:hypothetical protein